MQEFEDLDHFRASAKDWLRAHIASRVDGISEWGQGSDSVAVFTDQGEREDRQTVEAARNWHRKKLEAGWALLSWPRSVGGQGLSTAHEQAFREEESSYEVPHAPEPVTITLSMVGPTIGLMGTPKQQKHYLPHFGTLDWLVCQIFSEPNAGSDLASVRCQAIKDGDTWVINGQKVWTSGARYCDFGMLIARTDAAAPKHKGMTAFIVPLDSAGLGIRPIRQMTGGASFNEVFFDNVRIGDECRLGEEGDGWKATLAVLGFERGISGDGAGGVGGSWDQVLALTRHLGADSDPIIRDHLMRLYIRTRVLALTNERTRGMLSAGQNPGLSGSIGKLFWAQTLAATSDVVSMILGPRLTSDTGEWGTYAWAEHVLGAPGYRIAGGSDEIQRNIIGERVLGLPREPEPIAN